MFKLTALLCAGIFLVLLIAGEDRGQLRPGLANAGLSASLDTAAAASPEPAQPAALVPAALVPAALASDIAVQEPPVAPAGEAAANVASVSAPVTVTPATTPQTAAAIDEAVFSLATFSDSEQAAPAQQAERALAYVTAATVNVREGPGTANPVLTKLSRGEAVLVVATDQTGWAQIRIEGDGLEGFMSMQYLSATAP